MQKRKAEHRKECDSLHQRIKNDAIIIDRHPSPDLTSSRTWPNTQLLDATDAERGASADAMPAVHFIAAEHNQDPGHGRTVHDTCAKGGGKSAPCHRQQLEIHAIPHGAQLPLTHTCAQGTRS